MPNFPKGFCQLIPETNPEKINAQFFKSYHLSRNHFGNPTCKSQSKPMFIDSEKKITKPNDSQMIKESVMTILSLAKNQITTRYLEKYSPAHQNQ